MSELIAIDPSPHINAFWNAESAPEYYKRSSHQFYTVLARTILAERGVINPALDNLITHLPNGAMVAGGYVAHTIKGEANKASDIDLFFTSGRAFAETYNMFINPRPGMWAFAGYKPQYPAEEILKYSYKMKKVDLVSVDGNKPNIQLIKMFWYNNAEHVIDSFDFTITQFCISGEFLTFNPISMIDLYRGHIVQYRHQFPADTLHRLAKYSKKGYTTPPHALIQMANNIRAAAQMDPPELFGGYDNENVESVIGKVAPPTPLPATIQADPWARDTTKFY